MGWGRIGSGFVVWCCADVHLVIADAREATGQAVKRAL